MSDHIDLGELPAPELTAAEPTPRRSGTVLAAWLALPLLPIVAIVTALVNIRTGDGAFTHGMVQCLPYGMGTALAYFVLVYIPVGIVLAVQDRRDARR